MTKQEFLVIANQAISNFSAMPAAPIRKLEDVLAKTNIDHFDENDPVPVSELLKFLKVVWRAEI